MPRTDTQISLRLPKDLRLWVDQRVRQLNQAGSWDLTRNGYLVGLVAADRAQTESDRP